MKRRFKKILIVLFAILLLTSFFYTTKATIVGDYFKSTPDMSGTEGGKKIVKVLAIALEVVRNVGVGIAILMLIILGCKYMIASAGDRADIKKHAVTYVLGSFVLFAAAGIFEILKQFALSATGG